MNKQRRNDLLDVVSSLEEAYDRLNEIRDEEQEALDNMPESLQTSSRGEAMQEAIDEMDSIAEGIESVKVRVEKMTKAK